MVSSPVDGSPAASLSAHSSAEILTPSRKVQALLARFDNSESESDSDRSRAVFPNRPNTTADISDLSTEVEHVSEEEDEAIVLPRKSRMAARLEVGDQPTKGTLDKNDGTSAYERVKEQLPRNTTGEDALDRSDSQPTTEDEPTKPPPRRRLLIKRKISPVQSFLQSDAVQRSPSPMFFESPSAHRNSPSPHQDSDSDELPDNPLTGGNSKFLALVEKHRQQRLEKEAAEAAKKAARETLPPQSDNPRKHRGSSPADDTEEESDRSNDDAAKKLTSEARPTRKASRKAIEEMNRETQRMSRNMQLTHQARTKKKITKESLLARFNFALPTAAAAVADLRTHQTSSSSVASSDGEMPKAHDTPPTSPLGETFSDKGKESSVDRIPTILDPENGLAETQDPGMAAPLHRSPGGLTAKPIRIDMSARVALLAQADEDDSDLEIITSKSHIRKYAVFERLPKRKAKETRSHLALRSLAHLIGGDDKKHSKMTTVEMEVSLRKAARMQAQRERQEKIEELKAKGVIIQTAEERERDQQEVEDLVERARQEAAEISRREKALAKKDGTFVNDGLDDDDTDSDDEDFQEEEAEAEDVEDSEDENTDDDADDDDDGEEATELEDPHANLIDEEAGEQDSDEESEEPTEDEMSDKDDDEELNAGIILPRKSRNMRVLSDDEDDQPKVVEHASPHVPGPAKTPQSLVRSARKQIPGLQMSDDLPLGLTQAFAATMADSQSQIFTETQEPDNLELSRDLPSTNIASVPRLNRLDSIDIVSDSQPASQTQPLNINLSFSQSQMTPQSPSIGLGIAATQFTPSHTHFEPTQDEGYMFSPFQGSRFASETPRDDGQHSTLDTVIMVSGLENSPILQRKGRLRRGRVDAANPEGETDTVNAGSNSAFEVMRHAAKKADLPIFDKTKSHAKDIVDEAAEESEDEYAGLGGASDDDGNDEENEDDRQMIDEDTEVGRGDEAKLAGLYADRERQQDEAAVSKLLKDITTGALRRKRGVNDDLDLSDEEDAAARRREAKRREFAKMRRELLKDEAVGKIAEDKKKEAFLRSMEDRDEADDEEDEFGLPEVPFADSQGQSQNLQAVVDDDGTSESKRRQALEPALESQLNKPAPARYRSGKQASRRPTTLAEIRDSVSFLIEEPDSQASMIDLGLSESDEEPEAYVNLDRHFQAAEADENIDEDEEGLGDFIVDDDGMAKNDSQESVFKKPDLPSGRDRAPFSERRTKERPNVVNRLNLLRQASSSSSSSSSSSKMAFYTAQSNESSFSKVPALLRRATTNSSFGSSAGKGEKVSATGVVTNRTERGSANEEKEFVRKGSGGRRNAVNYRPTMKEEKMSQRAGIAKKAAAGKGNKGGAGFLGGLFRGDSWT